MVGDLEGNPGAASPAWACRDALKRSDQSEFAGFEYINPLLLSTEEAV